MFDKNLYPINYRGKLWKEDDCDDVFVAYYRSRESLAIDKSVYIGEGDWILPDGEFSKIMCRD